MPTYDYRCPDGHVFEEFQSMKEEPGAVCPQCGKDAIRLIGAGSGLMFKGTGFYITDYKKKPDNGKSEKKPDPGKNDGN